MLPSYDFLSICLNLFSWTWINWKEITFLQYIWLKDKNGKEVYEWDIFKKDNTIWDIRWNDYHMCYNMYYFYGLDDVVDSLRDFEIIWNIYENPELLEFNS